MRWMGVWDGWKGGRVGCCCRWAAGWAAMFQRAFFLVFLFSCFSFFFSVGFEFSCFSYCNCLFSSSVFCYAATSFSYAAKFFMQLMSFLCKCVVLILSSNSDARMPEYARMSAIGVGGVQR